MKKKFLLMTILMIVSAFSYNLYAQTDVTGLVGTTVNDWNGERTYGSSVERYYGSFPCAEHPLYQQITGLDAGVYLATLKATSNLAWIGSDLVDGDATYAYVYASNGTYMDKSYFPAHRATGISTYYDRSVVVEIADNQTLELGLGLDNLYLSNWHTIQIVSLMKYDSFDELVGPLKNPLKAKLDEVNSYYTNSDDNPDETAKNAFKTAIDAGQAIYDSKTTYAEVVEAVANGVFEQAIADLEAAYEIYALSGAIPHAGYPFDITFKIVNPTFGNNDATGWTYSGAPGFQTFGNAEYFQSNFDIYQTISNMPQAKYLLKVKAFQRPGPYADVISAYVAAEDKEDGTFGVNAEIYVNNASKKIKNAASPMRTSALGKGGNEASSEGYYIPDDMNSADKYFIADYYENEAEIICTTGDVKFGFRCTDGTGDRYWTIFDDFRLYLTDAIDMSAYVDAWAAAVAAAEQAITDYPNVTGNELTALSTAMADEPEETIESYQQKTKALQDATEAFIAAAPAYNAFVTAATTEYPVLAYAASDKKTALDNACNETPTSAQDAQDKTNQITVALRAYYESHALAEGVEGSVNMTESIVNYNATDNTNGWDCEGNVGIRDDQSWTDSQGNHNYKYFDGGNWNGTGWSAKMTQEVLIPAGRYLLTAKGRCSDGVTLTMSIGDESVEMPNMNDVGNVFDRGWGDASVEFKTIGDITIQVEATTEGNHQWFSISDFRLVQLEEAVLTDLLLLSSDTEAPEEQFAGTVTTDRVLLEGLNTLVFPFETTKEEIGATTVLEYTGTSIEAGGLTLNFSEVETLMPNVPYAVMLDNDAAAPLSFEFKEVTPSENLTVVDAGHEFDFVGTYVDIPKGNDIIKIGDYVAGETAFKKAKGGNRVAAYRAYLKRPEDVPDEPTNVAFNFDGEVITGIEAVELFNRMSGDMYNLNGQKVNRTQKGIYIINGQKVVVK